jgi:hypothetical protein
VRVTQTQDVEKAAVDLVDDLQVAWQHALEKWQGPLLQRLRKQCVVGVGHGVGRDLPGRLPFHAMHIDQKSH